MIKKLRFAAPSIFLYAVCLYFFIGTFSIKQVTYGNISETGVSPKFIPLLVIISTFLLATLNLIKEWPHRNEIEASDDSANSLNLVLSIIVIILCARFMKFFGFIIVGTFFMFCEFLLLENNKLNWKLLLRHFLASVIITLIVFAAFEYGFKMGVPTGTIFY